MNIVSQFLNIAKKETIGRSGLRSLIKDMHEDVVDYRKENQRDDSVAVSSEITIGQFRAFYRNLQLTSLISFSFIVFMICYFFLSQGLMIKFTISAFFFISLLWHFSFVIRAYRARIVFSDWDNRCNPLKISFEEVFDELLHDPRAFAPFLISLPKENNEISKINKCDRINNKNKKGFNEGDL